MLNEKQEIKYRKQKEQKRIEERRLQENEINASHRRGYGHDQENDPRIH